jgi:acetate kinase
MRQQSSLRILTINSGSSSLKFSVHAMGASEQLMAEGMIDRIGVGGGSLSVSDGKGDPVTARRLDVRDHAAAIDLLLAWLRDHGDEEKLDAVGHRVVHGGPKHSRPEAVTPSLIALLRGLIALAPDHLPHELTAIEAMQARYPALTQVACFDTAFHRHMPKLAQLYGLPWRLYDDGILRYGFHGLSCEYILEELRKEAGDDAANGRVIVAHLGNGASMVATCGGRSVDVTMGFTPTSGLVMSTRSGDLDPAVVLHLLAERGMTVTEVARLVNREAGLLGLSGTTSDMRDLLAREGGDARAAEAVGTFCYQARKFLGALAAALGGLDTLVFSAGIGEHAPAIRWRICEHLDFMGLRLDADRNQAGAPIISTDDSAVEVRVMKTNEELMIARHTYRLIRERST